MNKEDSTAQTPPSTTGSDGKALSIRDLHFTYPDGTPALNGVNLDLDPEDQLFMPTLTQDVAFGPQNQGLSPAVVAARVHQALCAVGLEAYAERPPHHLSFGQKKRAAIAAVLSMQPDLLVLDEPSSNLDPAARRSLAELLLSIEATRLVVTHDLAYALQTCRRAVIMHSGCITADGSADEIVRDQTLLAANGLEWPFGFMPG